MFKFKRNTKFKITKFHNPSSSIIRVIFYIAWISKKANIAMKTTSHIPKIILQVRG